METLEIIRNVIGIIRDVVLIIAFVVVLLVGLTVISLVSSIDTSKLSCESLISGFMSGDFSLLSGGTPVEQKYEATEDMGTLMAEIEGAAATGDWATAITKMDEFKTQAQAAEMDEVVEKIDELKEAAESENYMKVLATASQLKQLLGK